MFPKGKVYKFHNREEKESTSVIGDVQYNYSLSVRVAVTNKASRKESKVDTQARREYCHVTTHQGGVNAQRTLHSEVLIAQKTHKAVNSHTTPRAKHNKRKRENQQNKNPTEEVT